MSEIGAPEVTAPQAAWTVLCVDDEPNIVAALRRVFRGSGHRVLTATSGAAALVLLEAETVELVITDMRMPEMDGAQLLAQVRQRWPDIGRVLLTGYTDMASTVAAINLGEVYRYLSKPWNDAEVLGTARQVFERHAMRRETLRLQALTQQQNAQLAELNATLELKVAARTSELTAANGQVRRNYLTSIKVFSNLIELRGGGALGGHARRVASLAQQMAQAMGASAADAQQVMVAGLLHDMGQICLPDAVLALPVERFDAAQHAHYRRHPMLAEQALTAMDDMQAVAAMIRSHHERHDGRGFPDALAGSAIPLGARILAVADCYDDLQSGHLGAVRSPAQAKLLVLQGRGERFDPQVVDAFVRSLGAGQAGIRATRSVTSDQLEPGMTLARELLSPDGVMLLPADQVLNPDLIRLLAKRAEQRGSSWQLQVYAAAPA